MKRNIFLMAAAALLAGCADFRLGAVCYLPANHAGNCQVIPPTTIKVEPPAPAASGASV
jgi:hypothetical protein